MWGVKLEIRGRRGYGDGAVYFGFVWDWDLVVCVKWIRGGEGDEERPESDSWFMPWRYSDCFAWL